MLIHSSATAKESMRLGHHWTAFGVIKYLGLYLAVTAYFLAFSLQSSVIFEMST